MPTGVQLLDPAFLRKLERLSLVCRKPFPGQMKGEKRSTRRGSSVEFTDYREYIPGDDLRYVDWNMAARSERFYLKLFVEEEDLFLALLVDSSRSMGFGEPRKIDCAIRLAAAVGYIGLVNYDRVMVQPYSSSLRKPLPVQRGRVGIAPFFAYLQQLEPAERTDFAVALHRFAAGAQSRGLAMVISDFFDPNWQEGLKALFARGFQVTVLHLLAPDEMEPTLRGDLRIIDSETSENRELSITPQLLQRYRQTLEGFCNEIATYCRRYGADYLRVSSDLSLEEVALRSLRKMGLLR
ncbi:hypothetical protein CTKA_00787 [Chthonomonas calidirosea]|uniref:Uncharacterized conserved protein (Some members contain a von Willebrand factor type A (VWA) domain) n=1 Tax=Chthonomonas calidirosea (strain DSM 23976 / ICMP 18418 / T49) TaxID=1303518 RepID=S0EV35_CHTCT|nr:DUF58 domain-containing protein [Chthonomonas calidirosea]CCW34207.1 Uncharacterized conserved protein (some members contain a von Willebrand factor type A (vWA) domain) [Chthonomonas calidirosea T49]CEK15452.1 hypothetical protein CTKA_00787 [Chthonomonas calidirosea]